MARLSSTPYSASVLDSISRSSYVRFDPLPCRLTEVSFQRTRVLVECMVALWCQHVVSLNKQHDGLLINSTIVSLNKQHVVSLNKQHDGVS